MNVLDRITQLRRQRNWTEYKLAEMADIPQSTISSWYRKHMTPTIPSLEKICMGFGVTLSQFFAQDDDLIDLTEQQRELLERWNALTTNQKNCLLAFLKTVSEQ